MGQLIATGKVGGANAASLSQAAEGARVAVLNALAQVAAVAGGLVQRRTYRASGCVREQRLRLHRTAKVANAASDLLVGDFGDAGRHVRGGGWRQ
jgi:hypothetical protein